MITKPTEKEINDVSCDFTEAEGFRHGARWALDRASAPALLAERDRLLAVNAELVRALEDLQREYRPHVIFKVKKHFSLMVADAAATKALALARGE